MFYIAAKSDGLLVNHSKVIAGFRFYAKYMGAMPQHA